MNKNVLGLGPQLSKVLTSSSPDLNAANLLINAKADVNGISSVNFKDTYLGFACFEGRFKVVRFLLENLANPNLLSDGRSPLAANFLGKVDKHIIQLLIEKKAKVDLRDVEGYKRTALGYALLMPSPSDADFGAAKLLIDAKANVDGKITGLTSMTYLTEACDRGKVDEVRFLLENGASPDRNFPLFYAVEALRSGVSLESVKAIVTLLMDKGAQINSLNPKTDQTVLDFAEKFGREELVQFLRGRGAKEGASVILSKNGRNRGG